MWTIWRIDISAKVQRKSRNNSAAHLQIAANARTNEFYEWFWRFSRCGIEWLSHVSSQLLCSAATKDCHLTNGIHLDNRKKFGEINFLRLTHPEMPRLHQFESTDVASGPDTATRSGASQAGTTASRPAAIATKSGPAQTSEAVMTTRRSLRWRQFCWTPRHVTTERISPPWFRCPTRGPVERLLGTPLLLKSLLAAIFSEDPSAECIALAVFAAVDRYLIFSANDQDTRDHSSVVPLVLRLRTWWERFHFACFFDTVGFLLLTPGKILPVPRFEHQGHSPGLAYIWVIKRPSY